MFPFLLPFIFAGISFIFSVPSIICDKIPFLFTVVIFLSRRFYEIHKKEKCDSDTCYRFFEDFDTSICHYDTCWHELFYPLTRGYKGYESIKYTRAFSLLFLVFILGYLAVTKPWK